MTNQAPRAYDRRHDYLIFFAFRTILHRPKSVLFDDMSFRDSYNFDWRIGTSWPPDELVAVSRIRIDDGILLLAPDGFLFRAFLFELI